MKRAPRIRESRHYTMREAQSALSELLESFPSGRGFYSVRRFKNGRWVRARGWAG
jgi:hypothetical protein